MTVIIFLIVLAILVFVHELGHFLAAKKANIRVDEFAIGFPPRIFSWIKGETRYSLNLIPIGGYVKIFGENPDDQSVVGPDKERSFINQKRHIQAMVLAAGVFFNILFAWFLISVGFMAGFPTSVDGQSAHKVTDAKLIITQVYKDSPAEISGIMPGDVIRSLETASKGRLQVTEPEQVQNFVSTYGSGPIKFILERSSKEIVKDITPSSDIIEGKFAVGIAMDSVGILKLPFFEALYEGAKLTFNLTIATTKGLATFIYQAFAGTADFSQVAGPVGIASIVGNASKLGLVYLISFTAIISINLAVINLIPFPALDGGRLLFVAIESIIRRPINYKIANYTNAVGFALLLLLMAIITYKDVIKIF